MTKRRVRTPALGALIAAIAVAQPAAGSTPPAGARYPYGSAAFEVFVADSYRETRGVEPFARWLERTYAATPAAWLDGQGTLAQALAARRAELAASRDAGARARLEAETGAWLHRAIKAMIPRFSLDRGFEFTAAVTRGERQCLLQSVLIAGLLQAMGVDAGVAMVWKNERGEVSNNGHAVTMVRLSDGRDLLVDASEREPFAHHRGLFVAEGAAYRFVELRYSGAAIAGYRTADGARAPRTRAVRPLDAAFVRSQFYYYRGERAPGGVLGRPATPQGLAASARFLETAQRLAPQNPLAVYVLGHVRRRQGRIEAARAQYVKGYRLYRAFGWVPEGPRAAVAQASP